MSEFLHLTTPSDALKTLLSILPEGKPAAETIDAVSALGRVLAEDISAPHPLPEFMRSAMDGYAVRARDTFGVSESAPGYLALVGEVTMGDAPSFVLSPGTCAIIHTGGMLPSGADAVMMLEYTQEIKRVGKQGRQIKFPGGMPGVSSDIFSDTEIEISRPVAEGENIICIGEDVSAGQVVLAAGRLIRPAEIGGCMALGITKLRVANKPKIGILSSGDEVVPPQVNPRLGQVRDINSYSLAALVTQAGGDPILFGIVPDKSDLMKTIAAQALDECAALLITAGSSASARDMTADVIASLGEPGVLVHGVGVRPGKPTILALCNGKAVIGLPGNPVSALVIARLFVIPVIEKLLGKKQKPLPMVQAKLSVNLSSQAGREDWVSVKIVRDGNAEAGERDPHYLAIPVFGKSNLIFSLAAGDGLVCIPPDATGLRAGEMVEVVLIL